MAIVIIHSFGKAKDFLLVEFDLFLKFQSSSHRKVKFEISQVQLLK